jgi:type I restriction enzyme S subunit
MNPWREVRLGDLVEAANGLIRIGPFGSQLHAHEYADEPGGVPVVMPKDMVDGRVDRRSVKRVDQRTAERLKAHRLVSGDIVLARRGDVGRYAFIEDDEEGWLCGTGSVRVHVADRSVVLPRFLRHAIANPGVPDWLLAHAVGATMPNLNGAIVADLPLRIPGVETQRRIIAVLDAFVELIEINESRIGLLEDLARSVYREWFVRFRFPGHDRAPSDDLNGKLPGGWFERRVGDVASVNPSAARAQELPDPIRYLDISAVMPRRVSSVAVLGADDAPGRARRRVTDGDIVWATVRPNRRAHALIHDPPDDLIVSTGLAVLKPQSVPSSYLFEYSSTADFTDYLMGRATGSAYPAVRPVDFEEAPIVVPPEALLDEFDQLVDPMLRLVSALREQNRALAATRDLLLPRLVTGRLDVSHVDLGDLLPPEVE